MIYTIKNQFLGAGGGIPTAKLRIMDKESNEEKLIKIREELKSIMQMLGEVEGFEFITYMEEVGAINEQQLEKFFDVYF